MFDAGCIHLSASSSNSTRFVSSDAILTDRCDEANSGFARISRRRARNSSSVAGGAIVCAAVVGVAAGVGVGVFVAAGVGVVVGVGRGVVACVRGVGVGVAAGRCVVVTRRSRCAVLALACGAGVEHRRSATSKRWEMKCGGCVSESLFFEGIGDERFPLWRSG